MLNHGSHLAQGNFDTAAATAVARPYSALLSTLALALGTYNVSSESELGRFALVKILEGNVDTMNEILGLAWSLRPSAAATTTEEASAATTKELAEQILQENE